MGPGFLISVAFPFWRFFFPSILETKAVNFNIDTQKFPTWSSTLGLRVFNGLAPGEGVETSSFQFSRRCSSNSDGETLPEGFEGEILPIPLADNG